MSHVSFTDASPTGQFITGSDKQNASDIDGKVTALLASDLIINTPLVTDSLGRSIYCTYQVNQVSIILRSAEATILATHKIPVTNGATCKMISIGAGGVITVAGIASGTIAGKTAAVPNDSWVIHLDSNLIAY